MITNLLRRFCAPEVHILLTHLEEHFEDFVHGGNYEWEKLLSRGLEDNSYMTKLEKFVVRGVWLKAGRKYKRAKFLGKIVKQKIAPETEDVNPYQPQAQQAGYAGLHAAQQAQQQAHLAQQAQQQAHLAQQVRQAFLAQQLQQASDPNL